MHWGTRCWDVSIRAEGQTSCTRGGRARCTGYTRMIDNCFSSLCNFLSFTVAQVSQKKVVEGMKSHLPSLVRSLDKVCSNTPSAKSERDKDRARETERGIHLCQLTRLRTISRIAIQNESGERRKGKGEGERQKETKGTQEQVNSLLCPSCSLFCKPLGRLIYQLHCQPRVTSIRFCLASLHIKLTLLTV